MTVSGVHPGVIREGVKETGDHAIEQGCEPIGIALGIAHPTREQAVPAEQVGMPLGIVVEQGDGSRGMAHQVNGPKSAVANGDEIPIGYRDVGWHLDGWRIENTRVAGGASLFDDLRQGLPVIGVTMSGHDRIETIRSNEGEQAIRIGCRVDEHLGSGLPASQQVGIVVMGPDRDLGEHERWQLADVRRSADPYLAGIHWPSLRPVRA